MPYGLISMHDELRLFERILDFYKRLYPKTGFHKEERVLTPNEIGEILYTYAGGETESLAVDKMNHIKDALPEYSVPVILLGKGRHLILLDGHRRLRLAWKRKLNWKALVIVPGKPEEFGIEETVMGKIKEMYPASREST